MQMYMRTKICGIRSGADLDVAVGSGADAVGFISGITHRSEDVLSPGAAADLASSVPPFISKVLVTHLESPQEIIQLAEIVGVDTIQVHGLVTDTVLASVFARSRGRFRIIKAVHITGPEAMNEVKAWFSCCDALLLDSRTSDRLGGTGRTHDWSISRRIVQLATPHGLPVVLAGGLTPANVAEAVRSVTPYGVDVNSGVEDELGNKDAVRTSKLIYLARSAGIKPLAKELDGDRSKDDET